MLAAIDLHGCAGRLANRDSIRARVTVAVLRTDVWPGRAAHAAEGDLPIARHDQLTAK